MTWPNRIALILLALLTALVAGATAASADFAMHLQGQNPTVEAVQADGGLVFVARLDGTVQALDRARETVAWSTVPVPGARALDMVSEPGGPLYVATSIAGNNAVEPIVALDKATGHVLWDTRTAYLEAGQPHFISDAQGTSSDRGGTPDLRDADAYRLALDQGRTSPWLWAGLEHGFIIKLDKATGRPALDATGAPIVMVPLDKDRMFTTATNPCTRPSGIYALTVNQGHLWAARNFGGIDKQGRCANPLLTSLFNELYWLDADTLVDAAGQPVGESQFTLPDSFVGDPIDPANAPPPRRFALPAILDIDLAQWTPEGGKVYFGGAITGKAGLLGTFDATGTPAGEHAISLTQGPVITYDDDKLELEGPALPGSVIVDYGYGSIVSDVAHDASNVYMATWVNDTNQAGLANVPPGGFVGKFPLTLGAADEDWRYTTAADGSPNEVRGRSWEAGDVNALFVEPGASGKVLVAHGGAVPPYPGPGQPHHAGALVLETPKGRGPVPVLMMPYAGDILGAQAPIAFRTDNPGPDDASPVRAEIQYTHGLDGASWTTLGSLVLPGAPGNDYSVTNNVPFGQVPEGDDLRFRVRVTASDGSVGTDRTDGLVTVDRTPPAISTYGIVTADGEVVHGATGNPIVRTDQPTFFVHAADSLSDIDATRSFLWIDDPSHAYPFLEFQEAGGYVTGFRFDMAKPHPYGSLPARLADGPHVVHAETVDYAGNYDFRQWSIDVDTGVLAPTATPVDATWVADARPTWTLQFREDLEVTAVTLDGAPLTTGVQAIPQHPTQNPMGTRVVVHAPADLADGTVAHLAVTVRDHAGNTAGPFTTTLRVDRAAPLVDQAVPAQGTLLPDSRPAIGVQLRDLGSGLALGGARMLLDGQAQSGAHLEADRMSLVPTVPLSNGNHTVTVEARDLAGNAASRSWTFTVDTEAPALSMTALVPDGQSAAKRGDVVRLEAVTLGGATKVTFDARALDPAASAVVGRALGGGRFVANVTVTDARSGDLQVLATAVDAAGHKGITQAYVRVDARPPVAFLRELPAKVAHSFTLAWSQDGDTDAVRYILESQLDGGAWRTVDADVRGTDYHFDPAGATGTMRFRVSAVDGAGNRQAAPSNVVETLVVPSPIDTLLAPDPWPLNGTVVVSVSPVPSAHLVAVHGDLVLGDGTLHRVDLAPAGTLFRGTWQVTAQQGTGRLDLTLVDSEGGQVRASYPVRFQQAPDGVQVAQHSGGEATASRGLAAPAFPLAVLGLGLVALARRRGRQG